MAQKKSDAVVAVDDAVSDGKGGFLKKGDSLPGDVDADTLASLKAKGLVK